MLIDTIIGTIGSILDKIIPDKNQAAKAKAELEVIRLNGELDNMLRQIDVNQAEAGHPSVFVAGWRPAVGWICVFALGLFAVQRLVLSPLIAMAPLWGGDPTVAKQVLDILETIDLGPYMSVLFGMLGMGMMGLRTFEKTKGVAAN